jgi:hypothetical protein
MTTNTQDRDLAAIDDADLDAVSGGEIHDGCARAVLGFLYNNAMIGYLNGAMLNQTGPCVNGYKR